uniref:Uncharacterized protein LOC116953535 n=1 Tax=Petromyzon marinus TaxID=7757 RepID=A0AAJ7U6S9_PETMA|nr:uncharacterized protein LOC116953535 [Petromyzon marinus]XP_032829711.1 uncharacterized protein LOC116953535 [Petromyzon marinus]XP_032829712.1 uncharacterized protein LOC116953535 [Petromyzon marinus]XP_032829713.1 uncharacterized protein LOC116953535 [Petromyzon marinus]
METNATSKILSHLRRVSDGHLGQMRAKLRGIEQPAGQWRFLIDALDHVQNQGLRSSPAPHFEGDCTAIMRYLQEFGRNPSAPLEGSSSQESIMPLRSGLAALEYSDPRRGPSIATTVRAGSDREVDPAMQDCSASCSGGSGGSRPQALKTMPASCLPNSLDIKFSNESLPTVALDCKQQQQHRHPQQEQHPQEQRQQLPQQQQQQQQQQPVQQNLPACNALPQLSQHPAAVMSHASHPSNGMGRSNVDPGQYRGVQPSLQGDSSLSPDAVPDEPIPNYARQSLSYREVAPPSIGSARSYGGNPPLGCYDSMRPNRYQGAPVRRHAADGHSIQHETLGSFAPTGPVFDSGKVESSLVSQMGSLNLSPTMALGSVGEGPSPATLRPLRAKASSPGATPSPPPTPATPVSEGSSGSWANSAVSPQRGGPTNDGHGEDEVEVDEEEEEEFYTFVILHDANDNDIAEQVKVELENLDIKPGATFEDLQVGGEHQIGSVEKAVDNSAYTLLLMTSNFVNTWMQFTTHATLMNSINKTHKYNTVIPLLPRTRRLLKNHTPFALQAINPLDMALKTFEKKACITLNSKKVSKQKRVWEAEKQRLRRERRARAVKERQRRRDLEAALLAMPPVAAHHPEDGGPDAEAQGFGEMEAQEAGQSPPPGGLNYGCAAEGGGGGGGGCIGNMNLEGHTVQVSFPPVGSPSPNVGVGGAQNINIINITGVQNVQVGSNNVIRRGPTSPAWDGEEFFESEDNIDEVNDCQDN